MNMNTTLAWLLTYAVHSTLALAGMWIASRFLRSRNLALEEAGWKAAMFLTLLTTSLQVGLAGVTEYRPLAGSLELGSAEVASGSSGSLAVPMHEPLPESSEFTGDAEGGEPDRALNAFRFGRVGSVERPGQAGDRAEPGLAVVNGPEQGGLFALERGRAVVGALILWLVAASLLIVRFVVGYLLLLGHLKDRRMLVDGPHVALLEGLREGAGVVRSVGLSVCARISVPLALGLRRWEVCLPEKLTEEFDDAEQEAVLAHELAHLVRYDAIWLLAARTLAGVLFFQPLHFVALNRLRVLSELRCDDWAVEHTGRPVTLARCLTRVASWRSSGGGRLPVPAMAGSSRSHLGARVRRLVARGYPQPPGRVPGWLKVSMAPLVVLFVAAAPGVAERVRPVASAPPPPASLGAPIALVAGAPLVPTSAGLAENSRGERASRTSAPDGVSELPVVISGTRLAAPTAPPPVLPVMPVDPERIEAASRVLPAPASPTSRRTVTQRGVLSPRAPHASSRPAPAVAIPQAEAPEIEPPPSRPARSSMVSSALSLPLSLVLSRPAAVSLVTARFAVLNAGGSFEGRDEDPNSVVESDRGRSKATRANLGDTQRNGSDAELNAVAEALDAELDALEEVLEHDAEAFEDELEDQLEALSSRFEEQFEALYGLASLIRFEQQHEREFYELGRNLGSLADGAWGEDLQRRVEEVMEAQQRAIELRLEAAASKIGLDSLRLESAGRAAELDRFHEEMVREMRLMLPIAEELEGIRAGVEWLLEAELAPRMRDFDRIRADLHRALREWRKSTTAELEKLVDQNGELIPDVE